MADIAGSALVLAGTEWLLASLVHTTVLIGSTWAVARVTSLTSATRNALWKAALIGGMTTATLATIAAPPVTPALFEIGSVFGERVVDPTPECQVALTVAASEGGGWRESVRASCATPPAWWPVGLIVVWLLGVICGGVSHRSRRHGLRVMRASLRGPGPRAQRLFNELRARGAAEEQRAAARARLARTELRVSPLVSGPCVLPGGLLVLSHRCEAELSDAELRAALGHELAHVARGDLAWHAAARWIGVVLWMQPLGRLVRSRLSSTSEVLCDEWAVNVTGERYGLASSIARVAEWAASAPTPAWGVGMVGRGSRTLSDRVRRILQPDAGRLEPRWLAALVVVLLVAPLYWLPTAGPTRQTASLVVEEVDVVHTGGAASGERRIIIARASIAGRSGPDLLQPGLTPILAGR